MPFVQVIGGCAIDYVIFTKALPRAGGSETGDRFLRDCGGKGLNQAVAAARLGAEAALGACIGDDDAGDEIVAALIAEGVNAKALARIPGEITARTLITVDGKGRKQTASYPGANAAFAERHLPREAFARGTIVLMQLEIPPEISMAAARMAHAAGARLVLDAAPPGSPRDGLLEYTDAVTMNDSEARALTGIDVTGEASALRAIRAIQSRGASRVAIAAAGGRAIADGETTRWLPNHDVEVIDTTGAGDACAAAIAVALAEGRGFFEACEFGHAAAALAATVAGARASLPARAAVDAAVAKK